MFASVRQKLTGAWKRLREGNLAKLFVFEFVVVLLGVLAAQWVANWAADQSMEQQAEDAFEDALAVATQNKNIFRYWAERAPCMIEKTQMVARAAADGASLSRRDIGRPALPGNTMPSWNEDVRQAALKRFGRERMEALSGLEETSVALDDATFRIRDAWSTFALLDPENGPASEDDRHAVRLAAVQAADYLRWLQILESSRTENHDTLELGAVEGFQGLEEIVDECGMLKDWG